MEPTIDEKLEVCQESINNCDGYLTEWEEGFIENVTEQYAVQGSLSPKQVDKLDQIYNKVENGGDGDDFEPECWGDRR